MSCNVHEVVLGDTGVAFEDHLKIQSTSLDLTDATVVAVLKTKAGTVLFQSNAEVLQEGTDQDKTLPNVRYRFQEGELAVLGTHDFQWVVTLASGRVVTRPPTPHQIKVCKRLNA